MRRVEVMKGHHFAPDTAEKKIRKFFDNDASRPPASASDDAATEPEAEFGCISEGEPPRACYFWLLLLLVREGSSVVSASRVFMMV